MLEDTSIQKLETDTNQLVSKLITENDSDKLKELTKLFNATQAKKSAVRVLRYNELLDSISNQIADRLANRSNMFTNKELIDYLGAIHKGIEQSEKSVAKVEELPLIQINNTEVNMSIETELDADSRDKVAFVIEQYLKSIKDSPEIIEVEEIVEETDEQSDESSN